MDGCPRINVTKCKHFIVFVHDIRRNISDDNLAEETLIISHKVSFQIEGSAGVVARPTDLVGGWNGAQW
jgi:hypothetical protein